MKGKYDVIRAKYAGAPFLVEKELMAPLVKPDDGKVIFVCNMTDLFADGIPYYVIEGIIGFCKKYPKNEYLFQTKNPKRFFDFMDAGFPEKTILGTTIETNRDEPSVSFAPKPNARVPWMWELTDQKYRGLVKRMVTIEPIMNFDVKQLSLMVFNCHPDFVNIGADSKENDLPEPSADKILELIRALRVFTEVRIKDNLYRLVPKESLK
jgi:hypothetical protein